MNPIIAAPMVNPIIVALPGIPALQLIEMEYFHSSSDEEEEAEGAARNDPGEVLDPSATKIELPAADEREHIIDGGVSYEKPPSPIEETKEEEEAKVDEDENYNKEAETVSTELQPLCLHPENQKESSGSNSAPSLIAVIDPICETEVKLKLQKTQYDVESFISAAQKLISKVQLLMLNLLLNHSDVQQQILALVSEFEGHKDQYDHCRSTYKNGPLEVLQMIEQNYVSMAREIEKLQKLANTDDLERRTGAPSVSVKDDLLVVSLVKNSKREIEVKQQLEKSQSDAETFIASAQELISKVQLLMLNLPLNHSDAQQQILALVSEFEGHKDQYDHCSTTYDNGPLEVLQMMEQNYVSMAEEIEKLQDIDFERRAGC